MWIYTEEGFSINLQDAQSIQLQKKRIEIYYESQSEKSSRYPESDPSVRYDFIDFTTQALAEKAYSKINTLLMAQEISVFGDD